MVAGAPGPQSGTGRVGRRAPKRPRPGSRPGGAPGTRAAVHGQRASVPASGGPCGWRRRRGRGRRARPGAELGQEDEGAGRGGAVDDQGPVHEGEGAHQGAGQEDRHEGSGGHLGDAAAARARGEEDAEVDEGHERDGHREVALDAEAAHDEPGEAELVEVDEDGEAEAGHGQPRAAGGRSGGRRRGTARGSRRGGRRRVRRGSAGRPSSRAERRARRARGARRGRGARGR